MTRLHFCISCLLLACMTLSSSFCWADTPLSLAAVVNAYKHQDLTGLSLNDLASLDVIPVDVTGTHTHLAHQVMLGARYMTMSMGGNLQGIDDVSTNGILARYPMTPTHMTSDMLMLDAMYAPSNSATLMLMLPYRSMSMDMAMPSGMGMAGSGVTQFTTHSSGFGDLSLSGNYTVSGNIMQGGRRILLNLGLSVPTGSINKMAIMPPGTNQLLEYPMQLGSGTYDITSGVTYLDGADQWAWGAQALATNHLGKNRAGYRLGDQYSLNSWVYYRVKPWLGPSLRLEYIDTGNVVGRDARLDPTASPDNDPNHQGGERLNAIVGLDLYAPEGRYKGNRLSLEYGRPMYQNLDGPQLKEDWEFTVSYSNTFTP